MSALALEPPDLEREFGRSSARRGTIVSQAIDSGNLIIWSTDLSGTVLMSEGGALESIGMMPGQAVGMDIRTWKDIPFDKVIDGLKHAPNVTVISRPSPRSDLSPAHAEIWSGGWVMTFAWNRSPSGRPIGVTCVTVPLMGAILLGSRDACSLGSCALEPDHAKVDAGEGRGHHREDPGIR
ncbi:hypothetical protein UFOVP1382_62 [uncultured Caudovirales phage]|uniref:Uncharacterized protein n=1 Tax=uncultured Caudovirales phage TaxID=2100421 RepID=A0A6J5S536_9CAUD|nr:hypothetical protein UFOVP1382_62 [uncultured Caudovirales phage]